MHYKNLKAALCVLAGAAEQEELAKSVATSIISSLCEAFGKEIADSLQKESKLKCDVTCVRADQTNGKSESTPEELMAQKNEQKEKVAEKCDAMSPVGRGSEPIAKSFFKLEDEPPMRLAIIVADKKSLIQSQVVPARVPKWLGGFVAHVASKLADDETIISSIQDELIKAFSPPLAEQGIAVEIDKISKSDDSSHGYSAAAQGGLVVPVRIRITGVDVPKVIEGQFGADGVEHFGKLLAALKFFGEDPDKAVNDIQREVVETVAGSLSKEAQTALDDAGIECKVEVKREGTPQ
jgi:hypothetical protein